MMRAPPKHILLIEDDSILRRASQVRLMQLGYRVTTAADGEQGLRHARDLVPDLILMDLLMPCMTGLEVLRVLRADTATRDIPVLIATNSSKQQDREEALRLGACDYLIKANFSLRELGERIAQVLGVPQ